MFNPTQEQVRRFFCDVFARQRSGAPLDAMQTLAAMWMDEHPEYQADLADADAAVLRKYDENNLEGSFSNPFLHLAMHLSISEQCSIDQPRGIRQAVELLTARLDDLHDAHHSVMEYLGEMLFTAGQTGQAPDAETYLAQVQRRATRD